MSDHDFVLSIIERWYQNHIRYCAIKQITPEYFARIQKKALLDLGNDSDNFDKAIDLYLAHNNLED